MAQIMFLKVRKYFRCGLVALAMCQSLVSDTQLQISQDDIYQIAKRSGFTNNGEMFSGNHNLHFLLMP